MRGVDHLDAAHQITELPQRQVFFGYEPKLGTAMRDQNWKMILSSKKFELYDLSTDRGEKTNLVETHQDRAKTMRTHIERWKKEVEWHGVQAGM